MPVPGDSHPPAGWGRTGMAQPSPAAFWAQEGHPISQSLRIIINGGQKTGECEYR